MLGESSRTAPPGAGVTQAGWVQAITTSFLSTGSGRSVRGLFAAEISQSKGPLPWSRAQQAAFLISIWNALRQSIVESDYQWIESIVRPEGQETFINDPLEAFSGTRTMLNQEQGVRGVLSVANEIFFSLAQISPDIFEFETQIVAGISTTAEDVTLALSEFQGSPLHARIVEFGAALATFDWRSADAPGLSDDQRLLKRAFRGSSGYVALREQLFRHIALGNNDISIYADEIVKRIS